jgi:hypothetical protein
MFIFKDNYPLDLIDDSEENTSFETKLRTSWTRKEGKKYFRWYIETMYDRITTMGELMKVELDFTLESLDRLEKLFYENFGTHTYSDGQTTASAEISSFCGDIARYMTVFTLANRPDLTLMLQPSKSVRLDTYMYPVLKGYNYPYKAYSLSIDREICQFPYAYYVGIQKNENYTFRLKNRFIDFFYGDKIVTPRTKLIYDEPNFDFNLVLPHLKRNVKLADFDLRSQVIF